MRILFYLKYPSKKQIKTERILIYNTTQARIDFCYIGIKVLTEKVNYFPGST